MAEVVVYVKRRCGYCTRAEELLRSKGVGFEVIDVTADPEREAEMVSRAGGRFTVPQIFIGGRHVGGWDDLRELDRRGGLDPLLETGRSPAYSE